MVAAAPGRVNLIGEHIDYNDGVVLPFAMDRNTVVAASKNNMQCLRLSTAMYDGIVQLDLASCLTPKSGSWTNYVAGVVAEFQELGFSVPGLDIAICSNVPIGSGLSSSASLEVAVATMLAAMLDVQLDRKRIALICQSAEHSFAGVPCGIMDQFASIFGVEDHLIKIDCQNQDVQLVPAMAMDDISFVVTNSFAKHELADGEYAARKHQSASALAKTGKQSYRDVSLDDLLSTDLTALELQLSRHVVNEIDRTIRTAELIAIGDWNTVGRLMYESHQSLRDDYHVSCEELDFLVEQYQTLGRGRGVIGARMTGAGFGGCTISIVNTDSIHDVITFIQKAYSKKYDKIPPTFVTCPSAGAQLIL